MSSRMPSTTPDVPQNCEKCNYPTSGAGCTNPACRANPTLSDERRAAIVAAQDRRAAEEAEREAIRAARRAALGRKAPPRN